MTLFKEYRRTKRVICPQCKGTKKMWGIDESDYTRTEVECDFCQGEGMMEKIKDVEYKRLNKTN